MALSQKPVRNGAIYCSPWCGAKCTHAAYKKARRRGNTLARRLGPGWKVHVWENLGWHYAVRHEAGPSMHEYWYRGDRKPNHYWVESGTTPQFCGKGATPQEALNQMIVALENASDVVFRIRIALSHLKKEVK